MKIWIGLAGVACGALVMASCTTMSKDECLIGAWGQKGYQDGLSGYDPSRLDDHVSACAKHGVGANPTAYFSAREDGLRTYCTWQNGFSEGRKGHSYRGVCRADEEAEFMPAYRDGYEINRAEVALSSAESHYRTSVSRVRDREEKLEAKQRELRQSGLSDEDRRKIRERIDEVRGEIRRARREAREAEDAIAIAEVEMRTVMRLIGSRYGL